MGAVPRSTRSVPLPAAAALLLTAAAALPTSAGAQSPPQLRGRVVLAADSTGLAGRTVVLHRVEPDTGMAVDSTVTGPAGRFSFPLRGDSSDVFVASARHAGVLYFGPAVHGRADRDDYRLTVYPVRAAGSADTLTLASRALVLTPSPGGVRVTDVVQVAGPAGHTLVGRAGGEAGRGGAGEPWWRLRIPEGARDARVLRGGVSARRIELAEGEARLSAPVPPAGVRVVLGYEVPAGEELRLRLLHPADHLEVVVREDASGVAVEGLSGAGETVSRGSRFRRWAARGAAAGRTVRVDVAGPGGSGVPRAAWIAAAIGTLLAVGAAASWRVARRTPAG